MRERNNEVTEAVKSKPEKGPNSEINLSWLAKIQAPYTDNIYIYIMAILKHLKYYYQVKMYHFLLFFHISKVFKHQETFSGS